MRVGMTVGMIASMISMTTDTIGTRIGMIGIMTDAIGMKRDTTIKKMREEIEMGRLVKLGAVAVIPLIAATGVTGLEMIAISVINVISGHSGGAAEVIPPPGIQRQGITVIAKIGAATILACQTKISPPRVNQSRKIAAMIKG